MRSFILRRMRMISENVSDLLLIGSRHSANTLHLQEFLTRNAYPYTYLDLDSADDVCATLRRFDIRPEDTPLVITSQGEPLRNPSLRELAEQLGLSVSLSLQQVHDVAVIGAGPAGLAAAVYAASEGSFIGCWLDTSLSPEFGSRVRLTPQGSLVSARARSISLTRAAGVFQQPFRPCSASRALSTQQT